MNNESSTSPVPLDQPDRLQTEPNAMSSSFNQFFRNAFMSQPVPQDGYTELTDMAEIHPE